MCWTRCIVTLSLGLGLATACGGPKVLVPPRLDLAPFQQVGLVTFTVENAEGSLGEFATQRFIDQIFDAQRGVEVLELGDAEQLMRELGTNQLDAAAMRRIAPPQGASPATCAFSPRRSKASAASVCHVFSAAGFEAGSPSRARSNPQI